MLKAYKTLIPYLKRYKYNYIFGLLFLVITDGGQLLIPLIIKKSVNLISQGGTPPLFQIGQLMLQMIGIALAIAIGRFFWRYFIQGASRKIESDLRQKTFNHLLTLDSHFFGDHKTGDLMARMTNDMKAIRRASGMAFVAFVDGAFMALAILIILFKNYPKLSLQTVYPLPLITIMVLTIGPLLGKRFKKVQKGFSSITEKAREILSGIRVIKTFTKEPYMLKTFEKENENYKKANMELIKIWGLMFPLVNFLAGITTCLLLYFGGKQVMAKSISPGDFVALLSYLGMLIWPMMGAGFTINLLQRGAVSLERINKILHTEPIIKSKKGALILPSFKKCQISNLNFSYPKENSLILRDISFTLNEGETIGIMGRTGSGKSTLINLIPRILECSQKSISINNQTIDHWELSSLRKQISVIPQTTFLFSTTISENILFSANNTQTSENRLNKILEIVSLDREIKSFPSGLETVVGEKGVALSGGQKQRIAIARALYPNPDILIMDDALSAVDTHTEEKILNSLFKFREGKTNIIISHRISTLKHADKIIILDKGKIIQQGTHQELKESEGFYQKIYNLQSKEEVSRNEQ